MKLWADDRAMLDADEAAGDRAIERSIGWCAINSGSRNLNGLAAMAGPLRAALGELPGEVEEIGLLPTQEVSNDGTLSMIPNGVALRLSVRPHASVQIAITGHYDTVYPRETTFRGVTVRSSDRALNGPGIADMKGGLAVMLGALALFEKHPQAPQIGYTVLISPDEETGSLASAPLLAALGATAHIGLTYEPALADGRIVSARKGSGNFHLRVLGRAAHAGREFAAGRNALAAAARMAVALDSLNGRREGVTVNVARIDGGAPLNMVPAGAVLRFNARLPDEASRRWLDDALAEVMREGSGDGITTTLHGGITRPPKPLGPAQGALLDAVAQTGALLDQRIMWASSGGVCEGNNLHAAGLPGIDTLGVRGGDIHSEREYALPDSFGERIRLSALLLAKLATGEIDAPALRAALASEQPPEPTPRAG